MYEPPTLGKAERLISASEGCKRRGDGLCLIDLEAETSLEGLDKLTSLLLAADGPLIASRALEVSVKSTAVVEGGPNIDWAGELLRDCETPPKKPLSIALTPKRSPSPSSSTLSLSCVLFAFSSSSIFIFFASFLLLSHTFIRPADNTMKIAPPRTMPNLEDKSWFPNHPIMNNIK